MDPSSFLTRRRLLHHGAIGTGAAAAFSLLPRPLTAMLGGPRPEPVPHIQDDRIKALVQLGLDAAKSAGATYADIRMTHSTNRSYANASALERQPSLFAGVRALVNGYWGFASSPVWSPEELVRLGREATRQAKANTIGKTRDILMPETTPVRAGHWETPIEIDPFALHPDDIGDHLLGLGEQIRLMALRMNGYGIHISGSAVVYYEVTSQSKAFGATDGSYCTQRTYRSDGSAEVKIGNSQTFETLLQGRVKFPLTGAGWELVRNAPIIDMIKENILYNQEMSRLPVKPIEVGRYAAVLDAESVAHLLSQSIGTPTQLDRALGHEANAGGTSYLIDPLEMIGKYAVASPTLTVTANRTDPRGIATVRWDDEGTEPTPFTLVDRGVISDVQTSREGAGWIKPAYDRLQRPFRSNGCMYSETAEDVPAIHTPNLVLQPATTAASYKDLEAGVDKGMSIIEWGPQMDFQSMNGYSAGFECYEIANGKRVARIGGAGALFRTAEIWKSVTAIGGSESQRSFGLTARKGQPTVQGYHSVTAVPVALKELTFTDYLRR